MNDIETLIEMHTYKRPAHSASEWEFITRFLLPLGLKQDKHGNLFKTVGQNNTILWSSHTDSVHVSPGRQRLSFDGRWLKLHKKASSSCLGADDGAGMWLMMEMIKAGVPGFYIFHADEEAGGNGSHAFAKDNEAFLKQFKVAIAFDRRGTESIITHMDARTCSDAFAKSLALQLKGYKPDETGSFTDTKNYRRMIPECTNISVGYESAHTSRERLDLIHLIELRDQLVKLDVSALEIVRDPAAKDEYRKYDTFLRPEATLYDIIYRRPNAAAAALAKSGVTFEDFKVLVDAEQERINASFRDGSWNKKPYASDWDDDFDGLPGPMGKQQRQMTSSTNLVKLKQGMFQATPSKEAPTTSSSISDFPGHAAAHDNFARSPSGKKRMIDA